jgi:hypothetical protein
MLKAWQPNNSATTNNIRDEGKTVITVVAAMSMYVLVLLLTLMAMQGLPTSGHHGGE